MEAGELLRRRPGSGYIKCIIYRTLCNQEGMIMWEGGAGAEVVMTSSGEGTGCAISLIRYIKSCERGVSFLCRVRG